MIFDRITEQKAYQGIVDATKYLHKKGIDCKEIATHPLVKELELNLSRCTTSGYGICGQGEYDALFVTDGETGYRVFDIYINVLSPTDSRVDEISDSLGKLNPENKQCDIRNHISMAILHYLELFGELPLKYKLKKN